MKLRQNKYQIQRKFWQFFGATIYMNDADGNPFLHAKMKAFRLKEDIKIFKDDDAGEEPFLIIRARNIIDFAATYGVFDGDGNKIGALQRKGLKSTFVSDEWEILNDRDYKIGTVKERSALKSFLRRYILDALGFLFPQTYDTHDTQGNHVASMEQNMNPFIYKLQLMLTPSRGEKVDDRLVVSASLLLAAIEGKE